MKNILTSLFLLAIMAFSTTSIAQKNFDATLDALLQSEFMKQYQEIRTSAMASATAFKNSQERYGQSDIQRVEEGYNKVADKFNFVLLRLEK